MRLISILLLLPLSISGQSLEDLERIKGELEGNISSLEKMLLESKAKLSSIQAQIDKRQTKERGEFVDSGLLVPLFNEETALKNAPYESGESIHTLRKTDKVYLQGYYKGFFEITTAYGRGFIYKNDIANYKIDMAQVNKYKDIPITNEAKYIDEEKRLEKERLTEVLEERKNLLSKKYSGNTLTKIVNQKIWIGMTDKMAIDSRGKPNDINRSVNQSGVSEQWVYGFSERTYLYFDNGILKSWQE